MADEFDQLDVAGATSQSEEHESPGEVTGAEEGPSQEPAPQSEPPVPRQEPISQPVKEDVMSRTASPSTDADKKGRKEIDVLRGLQPKDEKKDISVDPNMLLSILSAPKMHTTTKKTDAINVLSVENFATAERATTRPVAKVEPIEQTEQRTGPENLTTVEYPQIRPAQRVPVVGARPVRMPATPFARPMVPVARPLAPKIPFLPMPQPTGREDLIAKIESANNLVESERSHKQERLINMIKDVVKMKGMISSKELDSINSVIYGTRFVETVAVQEEEEQKKPEPKKIPAKKPEQPKNLVKQQPPPPPVPVHHKHHHKKNH